MSQVQLSPCKRFIGQIQPVGNSIVLNIFNVLDDNLHRSFKMIDMIQSKFSFNQTPTLLDLSFQWEHNHEGRECEKLAVLVKNMAALFILDIHKDEASSVLVRQPQHEGISSFQWLPPTGIEKKTGYSNSSQIVLFSENNLSAKLYSLDCTSKLFTIHKPFNDHIINRKRSSGSFWCILADTFEYNVPPTVYQFLNTGPLSILMNSTRLQNFISEEAYINWSPSGNWLQIFDRNEALSGYCLRVYGSNGTSGPSFVKPLVDIDFESETKEKGVIKVMQGGIHSCWYSSSGEEFIIVSRVMGNTLEITGISMRLLKVVIRADYVTEIKVQSRVVNVIANQNRWFIITQNQVILYAEGIVKSLLSTEFHIYSASLLQDFVVVLQRGLNGEFWRYLDTKQSKQSRKPRSANQSIDEITDTFAMRKRARIQ
ncbi:hypothetical protein K4G60_g1889 [Candida parapsilosis]|nr:hypothetical protein K4G60_g1889 [Candida parapsilosis]KAI5908516.1 hypothetical protein K4G61_g2203 [Candida parapsilosis]